MIFYARLLTTILLLASLLLACSPPAPLAPTPALPPATATAATLPPTPLPTSPPTAAPTTAPTVAATATAPPPTAPPAPVATPTIAAYPVTVADDAGRSITFDRAPQRIISLSPGLTESLYALGVGDRVVVTDKYSDYPAANGPKAKLDTYPKPNAEQIVALQPDLILVLVEGDDFIQLMDARGIKVLKIFPKTFDGTLRDLDLLGNVVGAHEQATKLTSDMRERAATIVATTKVAPKVSVLYELDASDPTKPWVAGPSGFFGSLVPLAGGKNVFDDLGTSASQVSAEQILARNPSIIILGDSKTAFNPQTPAMVKARTGWSKIDAVKNGRIVEFDDALLSRPGPRLVDGLEQLAKELHPELFK